MRRLGDFRWFLRGSGLVAEPRQVIGAFLQRLFPGQRDDRGGEDNFDEEAHEMSEFVMTLTLSIEPIPFPLLIGVVDVPGKRCWRRHGCRWGYRRLDLRCLGWRREMLADYWSFADPLLERLVPRQRNQRGRNDDFEEKAHFGGEYEVRSRKSEVGGRRSVKADKGIRDWNEPRGSQKYRSATSSSGRPRSSHGLKLVCRARALVCRSRKTDY